MESLWADRGRTRERGRAAFETLARRGIVWDRVLDCLLAA
jgi:hypothetical protein